jgi:hypothetical protein
VIYEDDTVRVWNLTLVPGETMTNYMRSHDCYDYPFVAIQPTQLEVYGEDGSRLFDFRAEVHLDLNWLETSLSLLEMSFPGLYQGFVLLRTLAMMTTTRFCLNRKVDQQHLKRRIMMLRSKQFKMKL